MSEISSTSKLTTKEIIEQAISDYHESILPYLNGIVPTIANKFDKANLYSTDEKIVGRWTDGKPIYQKTYINVNTGNGSNTNIIDITDLSLDNLVDLDISIKKDGNMTTSSNNASMSLFIRTNISNKDYIALEISNDAWRNRYGNITIQYTKTTDEAIAIGSDTDYSTTEKIVGTWIDGKPLYQKTVDCGTLANKGATETSHNISNIDKVVQVIGICHDTNYYRPLPLTHDRDIKQVNAIFISDTKILIENRDENLSNYTGVYVTLQYTKTTDV